MSTTPTPPDPGATLMLAYQGGDEAAFEELVERYSGRVFALVTRFLGPGPLVEDLVQEVFLRVVRSRASYEPQARFGTWLYRIAFNLCSNQRERQLPRAMRSLEGALAAEESREPEDEATPSPSEGLERSDAVEAVRAALDRLPDNQRMALVLSKYEGFSHAEIAEVLESSEKAVKSLVHRARERLRELLRPFLQEELA